MEADKTFKFDITMPVIANDVFEGSFDAAFDQAFANFDAAFNKAFFPEGMPRMSELDTQRKELLVPPSDPTPDQLSDVQINDSARPAKPSTAGMIPKDPSMQIEVFEVSFDDAFDKAFEHFDDSFTKAFFPMQSVPEIDAIDNDSDLKVEGDDCGTTDDDRVGNENSPQEIVPDDQRTETGRKSIMDDIEVLISDNVRLENDDARRVDTEPSMHGDGDAPTAIQPVDAIHQLSSELNDILTLVGTEDLSPDANVPPFDDLTSQLDMNTYVDVLSNDSVSKMSGKYTNLPSSAIADDGGGTGGHGGEMIVSQAVIAEAEPVIADAASFIAFVKSSFMPDEGSVSKVTDGDARAEDGGINIDESYILGSSQKPLHSPIRASELPLEHHIENNPFRQFKFVVHHDDD
jgi:enamine deaminase RidA (YjgF/YER057c/UK114 family)